MTSPDLFDRAQAAADTIRSRVPKIPKVAVVLGSGLGSLAEQLTGRMVLPYADIPHFPVPTVPGHAGNFIVGNLDDADVAILQGRFHAYEGYDLDTVTFPIRVLARLGVRTLILTAAVGGIADNLRVGNLVCVVDHLNLQWSNPLSGPNDERLGTRFPDMTEVYSHRLTHLAADEARRLEIFLKPGVYASMNGPSYETPAEIRMLRVLGADVVGMSTVAEAIVARHGGMDVLAFALVTNAAAGITGEAITHEEVLAVGREAADRLTALLSRVISRLADIEQGGEPPERD